MSSETRRTAQGLPIAKVRASSVTSSFVLCWTCTSAHNVQMHACDVCCTLTAAYRATSTNG
eukprot:5280909-Alexandrium_andersonii.AAC.1